MVDWKRLLTCLLNSVMKNNEWILQENMSENKNIALTMRNSVREALGDESTYVLHVLPLLGEHLVAVLKVVLPRQARAQPLGHVVAKDLKVTTPRVSCRRGVQILLSKNPKQLRKYILPLPL